MLGLMLARPWQYWFPKMTVYAACLLVDIDIDCLFNHTASSVWIREYDDLSYQAVCQLLWWL
jgi:hypothetical protein